MAPEKQEALLLVDDDPDVRSLLRQILSSRFECIEAASGPQALQLLESRDPVVVLLDLNLGRDYEDGFSVLDEIRRREPALPVVILSDHRETDIVVRAMKAGATHYVGKTPRHDELFELLNALRRDRSRTFYVESQRTAAMGIVGGTPAMVELRRQAELAARADLPVLILGETGSGKGLLAERIHATGPRARGPFCDVNVAGLSTSLLDSELFGHERGAFTGADRRHRGLFELASGGSILLDEIGDLPRECQVKLLKVVEQGRFRRVGGEDDVRTDARVLAATHANLDALVRAKTFRSDLFHRLAGLVIRIPPLRDRKADIPLLTREFLGAACAVTDRAMDLLMAHAWPGNVRELFQTLRRAALQADGRAIDAFDLVFEEAGARPAADDDDILRLPYKQAFETTLERFRRRYVAHVLHSSGGNVAQAARLSGIARPHLHVMMKELGISRDAQGEE